MMAKIHPDFARRRLSPHFVYESYDSDTGLFFNRGSVGFILLASPLVGTSVQAQGEIAEFIKNEENLPADSSLQILMIGSNKIEHFLNNWLAYRTEELFADLAAKRTEFFRQKAQIGEVRDVVVLISITIPSIATDLENMQRRRENLQNILTSIGLYTDWVNSQTLIDLLRNIFGWQDKTEYPDINDHEVLSEQILRPDFSMVEQDEMILIGEDQAIASLEIVKRPLEWKLNLMDLFIGNEMRRGDNIACNYLIHLGVHILPNQGMLKAGALGRREAIMRNFQAGMDKLFPDLREEYTDLDSAVNSLLVGNRMINLHLNVILTDSPKKIKEMTQNYQSMMRRNGFNFVACKFDHLAVLLNSLPMQMLEEDQRFIGSKVSGASIALRNLGRGLKTISSEINALLPIIGEWKGDLNSPGLLLTGRRGQIMYWSPFGSALLPNVKRANVLEAAENFNICVAGTSGSGKSVLLQEIMWSTLGVGGKVFVLDYGRSFKHSCLLLQGTYIEFDTGNPISLNPFSEIPEGVDPRSIEVRADFLGSFPSVLATMAAPQYGTNDLQQSMLQKALIEVWKAKASRAEITDIADWLLARAESYAKELGHMLFPFTREGQYGKFFAGKAELSLKPRVVVIETDNLRNIPELMTVIIQIMMVHINQTMAKGDRKTPSLIIIDEMVKTLKSKRAGEFVDESSRIVRKYNTSIVVATQHLTDFFPKEGSSCEKIFAGSAFKIILKQNPESLKAMREIPQLSHFVDDSWKLNLLQSIHSVKHHYSEMAMFGPNITGVVARLMIDPFNLLLLSTDAVEYQLITDRLQGKMNLTEAIEAIIRAGENGQ